MYKIYFDQRLFIITDKQQELKNINEENCKIVQTSNEMATLIASFQNDNKNVLLTLYVECEDIAFFWFKKYFKLIEAAGGLVYKANTYLLIYRLNHWDLPKGKIEYNETPEEAAIREVQEECSINNLEITSYLTTTYHTYQQNDKQYLKKTYWYKMKYDDFDTPIPQIEEGIEKVEWVQEDNLSNYTSKMYKSIIEVFNSINNAIN